MDNRQFGLSSRIAGRVARTLRARFVRQALRRRGLAHAAGIHTFTIHEELEALFALARSCPVNARALEIGSYLGASTCHIAAGLRGASASITCVDTWQNEAMPNGARDTLVEFERNLNPVRQQLRLIRKRSGDLTPEELGGPFALVFIDGDHSYNHVRADFNLVAGCVASDGIVVFHDSRYWEGVSRVIGEALASGTWQIGGTVMNMSWLIPAGFTQAA